jgi:hypothetical protein
LVTLTIPVGLPAWLAEFVAQAASVNTTLAENGASQAFTAGEPEEAA